MAERDERTVKVTLGIQRPYRAKDEDKDAIWVGPGDAEVPVWVAQEWGMDVADQLPAQPDASPSADDLKAVEQQLEAETGSDVVKTGNTPPTFVETGRAVPKKRN